MAFSIQQAENIDDCLAVEQIQKTIWGDFGVVPFHMLITIARNGGVLLIAREDDQAVGFVLGFQGQTSKGLRKHNSHMAAVLPQVQHKNIGYQLKLAQRAMVLAQGIKLITWTYNPMLSRNAHFNISKLGATIATYHPYHYDSSADIARGGLMQDRFQVDWWIDSAHVDAVLAEEAVQPEFDPNLLLNPHGPQAEAIRPQKSTHLVQIPIDFKQVSEQNEAEAIAWQRQIRHIFSHAFNEGYQVNRFIRGENSSYYYLQQNFQP